MSRKIHFVSVDSKSACGRNIAEDFLTNDPAEVTCGNCIRTNAFKTASDLPADAVGITIAESESE